jgi:hypothetical protein
MALAGKCNNLRPTSFVHVNELTTVSAQWALRQFIDASGTNIGTSSTNTVGLENAITGLITDLVRSVGTGPEDSGIPAQLLPSSSQCEAFPSGLNCDGLERLNALANILAACVQSSGPRSSECTSLFERSDSAKPATTLTAAHLIVANPKRNVATIWTLQQALLVPPYQPTLTSAPEGWELAIEFIPAAARFSLPVWVAVDARGNIWVVNGFSPSISELPAGNYNDGATNFAPPNAGLFVPFALALDTAGDVFVANAAGASVSELPAGNFGPGAVNFVPGAAAFSFPAAIAVDKLDNLWIANLGNKAAIPCGGVLGPPPPCGSISELLAGNYATDAANFAPVAAGFNALFTIAVDRAGNIWTTNNSGNSVSELSADNFDLAFNFAPPSAKLNFPVAIVLDNSNNAWIANQFGGSGCALSAINSPCGSVSELLAEDYRQLGANFSPSRAGIVQPNSVALDSDGNVWVSNFAGGATCNQRTAPCGSVSELPAHNYELGGRNFAPLGAGFNHPTLLAIDGSGNVWVSHFDGVSELVGLAAPTLTPIQACLKRGGNVCRP